MISPRATIARASAIVNVCAWMSSSSSGLCVESGGGDPRIRDAEEDHLLVAVARRRVQAAEPLDRLRQPGRSLLRTPARRASADLARVEAAGRQLPDLAVDAVGVDTGESGSRGPASGIGISTTDGGCRTIAISCSRPFGQRARVSTSTENTRPVIDDGHRYLAKSQHVQNSDCRFTQIADLQRSACRGFRSQLCKLCNLTIACQICNLNSAISVDPPSARRAPAAGRRAARS